MKGLGSFGRDRPRHRGFTIVPNAVIRWSDLKVEPKLLLIYLLCLSWRDASCSVSQDRIATELSIDPRTVRRHLQVLVDIGVVAVIRSGARNRYVLDLSRFEDKNAPVLPAPEGENARIGAGENAQRFETISPSIQTKRYKDAATSNCDEPGNTEGDGVRAALVAAGINEPTLSTLARRCTLAEVENQLDWMQYRSGIRNVPSALISALMENWAEPEAARKRRGVTEARRSQELRAVAAQSLVESIGIVRSTVDDLWSLPSMERHMLGDRARRELGGDAAVRLYGDGAFAEMCHKYTLYLLDQRRAS